MTQQNPFAISDSDTEVTAVSGMVEIIFIITISSPSERRFLTRPNATDCHYQR